MSDWQLSRRALIQGSMAFAATSVLISAEVWAQPIFHDYPFSLGVASGDPVPDGFVLWTRLAPDPLNGGGMPMLAVEVSWEIAAERRFRTIVQKGSALARPELGHSVHVEVTGLEPGRQYFYRFRAGRELSPTGAVKTAAAIADRIRFVNAGCQRWDDGWFTAWRHIAGQELDFVFHYGDYIYEYRRRRGPTPGVREVIGDEIHTIVDYRNRYALYKSDPDLQAAHAAHAFVMTYDDHEVDNNWAGTLSEEDGRNRFPVAVPPEVFAFRKQMALQAWYEAMPVRRSQMPRGTDITNYRRLRFGGLVDLHVLDTRQFRDDQPCGDGVVKCSAEERGKPGKQMLGLAQEKWLMDGMRNANGVWQVLAQQVPVMQRLVGEGPDFLINTDKWDGHTDARKRLFDFVLAEKVKNMCVLTGDVHNAWASDLKADFDNPQARMWGSNLWRLP
jgi:alkaline phosphatase D